MSVFIPDKVTAKLCVQFLRPITPNLNISARMSLSKSEILKLFKKLAGTFCVSWLSFVCFVFNLTGLECSTMMDLKRDLHLPNPRDGVNNAAGKPHKRMVRNLYNRNDLRVRFSVSVIKSLLASGLEKPWN